MKRVTPTIFIIILVLIGSCSDDDSLGNRLDRIRYYDFVLPGSGFSSETKFYYDKGRVSKAVDTDLFDYVNVWEYAYAENLIIVDNSPDGLPYQTTYSLKFENGQLTRFTLAQRVGFEFETDSVEFFYESRKLNAFKFAGNSYPISVDESGNIIQIQQSDPEMGALTLEYDNHPNPFQDIPKNFIYLSFENGIENRLLYQNIVQFFSKNNLKRENL